MLRLLLFALRPLLVIGRQARRHPGIGARGGATGVFVSRGI
jgi:hypothetical protein